MLKYHAWFTVNHEGLVPLEQGQWHAMHVLARVWSPMRLSKNPSVALWGHLACPNIHKMSLCQKVLGNLILSKMSMGIFGSCEVVLVKTNVLRLFWHGSVSSWTFWTGRNMDQISRTFWHRLNAFVDVSGRIIYDQISRTFCMLCLATQSCPTLLQSVFGL